VILAVLLLPGVALAGPATDAALGLGAFAVFNQILAGTGVFRAVAPPVVAAPPVPVYLTPAPPVYAALPAPVYVAPPPVVVYPAPAVVVAPRPVFRGPRVVYAPVRRAFARGHRW
jgi:hypothetical protein